MTRRVIELLLLVALAAVWGWSRDSAPMAVGGALVGALVWAIIDSLRANRVLKWLNKADLSRAPDMSGTWGEVLERCRRLVKKLEKKAQNSDARLEDFLSAIQASPNGVVLLDSSGRIEWANLTAASHLGFDPQRDLGQYVRNMVRNPAFSSYLTEGDFSHEIQVDGVGPRPSQPSRISLQIHPYGKKRKLMLTRDITAVQLAEAMRRDFVANVSHEIRTPLTVLTGFVETLQTLPLNADERSRYLGMMAQQAQRMQSVVQDLLTLSRLEGSPLPGMAEWTPVQSLMQRCEEEGRALSALLTQNQQRTHEIRFPAAEALRSEGEIAGVPTELQSALSNLVNNAVRYTPAGGSIAVVWERKEDGGAVFSVQDTGPGIAPEHIPRLTERFYRVDRSRSRETGGTGLGLAITKHVMQRHGGELRIESVLGQGATFKLCLPASRVSNRLD